VQQEHTLETAPGGIHPAGANPGKILGDHTPVPPIYIYWKYAEIEVFISKSPTV
jgi:hypothetical protein